MATVYWGDGGVSATDGNWNHIANWFTSLTPDGATPGNSYGQVPQPGDSVVLAATAGTINITTGPTGGWAGPITWLGAGFQTAPPSGIKITSGSYSGTITISAQGSSSFGGTALPDYSGISGGTFSGTVNLNGSVGNASPVAITGGTFTGIVMRSVATLSTALPTFITGGTYAVTITLPYQGTPPSGHVGNTNLIPSDPGFAVGGGTYTLVINLTGVPQLPLI